MRRVRCQPNESMWLGTKSELESHPLDGTTQYVTPKPLPTYQIGQDMEKFNKDFITAVNSRGISGRARCIIYIECFPEEIRKLGIFASTIYYNIDDLMLHALIYVPIYAGLLLQSTALKQETNSLTSLQNEPSKTTLADSSHSSRFQRQGHKPFQNDGRLDNQSGHHGRLDSSPQPKRSNKGGKKRFAEQREKPSKPKCYNCGGFGHKKNVCTGLPSE